MPERVNHVKKHESNNGIDKVLNDIPKKFSDPTLPSIVEEVGKV